MKGKWILLALVALVLLGLGGYKFVMTYRANTAAENLAQAESAMRGGDVVAARERLEGIIRQYGETEAALRAETHLGALKARQELAEGRRAVESLRRVLEGYKVMYGNFPNSAADLDNGEYFFDSAYLAESIPAAYQLYLALLSGEEYKGYLVQRQGDVGFTLTSATEGLERSGKQELLALIAANFVEKERNGNLVFLTQQ